MATGDNPSCDEVLDALAQVAAHDQVLGNKHNWLFTFRSALSGFRSRLESLEESRVLVYEWHPFGLWSRYERHVAVMLFAMDSAFECLVFGLNALGQAKSPDTFRTVNSERALRQISPRDLIGEKPLQGWTLLFPRFQRHCRSNEKLITLVVENHDVTKHRQGGFRGGTLRSDPPEGFFEELGIGVDHFLRDQIAPMASVLIPLRPKLPQDEMPNELTEWTKLEEVMAEYRLFLSEALCLAAQDVRRWLVEGAE